MDSIINDLLNYAFDNKIVLIITKELSPYTPSAVNVKERRIIFNRNWHIKNQLAFQLAHEISHVINSDDSSEILYFTPSKSRFELGANVGAINMLLPYYMENIDKSNINVHNFMESFCIPSYLEDVVVTAIKNY